MLRDSSSHLLLLISVSVLCSSFHYVRGQVLKRQDKQALLDQHNYHRAAVNAANMRRLSWSSDLEAAAQTAASTCDEVQIKGQGTNIFYSEMDLPEDPLEVSELILEQWLNSGASLQQPILWARTTMVGCAAVDCPQLPLQGVGQKMGATRVFVCRYAPSFFTQGSEDLYRSGPCSGTSCPSGTGSCVQFGGQVRGVGSGGSYCALDSNNPQVPDDPIVAPVQREMTGVSPRSGSLAGGNHITITGRGFSSNQYNGGNQVIFMHDTYGNLTCDVVSYRTSQFRIECITREAPVKDDDTVYTVMVYANDGGGFEPISPCSSCNFRYDADGDPTALFRTMSPYAALPGTTVRLNGTFHANGFEDPDDPEDPDSSDRDDEGDDFFTRILIGGRACNHMREDGGLYDATINEDGESSTIECLPSLDGIIDSHNISIFLEERGMAYVRPDDHLVGFDNKLRPYHFQSYADILEVTPRRGSRMGGTRISVTVGNSLLEYEEDIEVVVGGQPCTDVTVSPNQTEYGYGVIQCTTPSAPPPSEYYPGGRGTLREVFLLTDNLNTVESSARSEYNIEYERLFIFSYLDRPDFGETEQFSQKFSGFFVPPQSSLYTFNLRSDDQSRLLLSTNASTELAERIINVDRHTQFRWDRYDNLQYSEPVYLEAGRPYYFEALSNNFGGPWDLGVAAKLHDSELNGGLYDSDKEEQSIEISSSTVQEIQSVSLEANPFVQRVTFMSLSSIAELESEKISCPLTLDLSKGGEAVDTLTVSPFLQPEEFEEILNSQMIIQEIGRVSVRGYNSTDSFGNLTSVFTLIYLTHAGVTADDLVIISVKDSTEPHPCSETDVLMEFLVNVETVQELWMPSMFQLGFNVSAQQQQLTGELPLDAPRDLLQSEMRELITWRCEVEEGLDQKTIFYADYELGGGRRRNNDTSFCGAYSDRNPWIFWQNSEGYSLSSVPYVCFAYQGNFRHLAFAMRYRQIDIPTRSFSQRTSNFYLNADRCTSWAFSGIFGPDGWSEYACVDVMECLLSDRLNPSPSETVSYDSFVVTQVWFTGSSSLYVDNLAIARTPIQVSQTTIPARPNDVSIRHIEVTKEDLSYPELLEETLEEGEKEEETSGSGSDPQLMEGPDEGEEMQYRMVVSRYQLMFSVRDCGFGMGPVIGSYDGSENAITMVEQIQAASRPVSGKFHISIGDKELRDVSNDVTRDNLQELLNLAFPDEGGLTVLDRSGSCSGYSWDVTWDTKPGDQPLMIADGADLVGDEVEIRVVANTDGGLWLRPLRGDMLRLPETEPQVEVIINGVPSSCTSKNCSFTFDSALTPSISSLSPTEGQAGTSITITGQGFSSTLSDMRVYIGESECSVTYSSADELRCTVGLLTAGCYKVEVVVDGMGVASTEDSLCYRALLSVDSVAPRRGGVMGGHTITLSGEGFMEFYRTLREDLNKPFSILPWFRFGIGAPYGRDVDELLEKVSEDPALGFLHDRTFDIEVLKTYLEDAYRDFPASVFVGSVPCIIVQSTITELSCVPLSDMSGLHDIIIRVLNQTVVLEDMYTISLEDTVVVSNLDPYTAPVTGGMSVRIMGLSFGSDLSSGQGELGSGIITPLEGEDDNVEVLIGASFCEVQSYSNLEIQCITSGHRPGSVLVLVSTTAGVAILESGSMLAPSTFPTFTYSLQVTDVSSSGGSVFGGTEVILSGGTFVEGETEVVVGSEEAEILSVSSNQIVFATPSSITQRLVKLSARPVVTSTQSAVTYEFDWSLVEINATVGDSVTWDWELDLPVDQQLVVSIFEILPPSELTPDVIIARSNGFSNDEQSDRFTVTFDKPGTHYFVTENNFNGERIFGVVYVSEPRAIRRPLQVYVGGFLAEYVPEIKRRRRQADKDECVDSFAEDTSNEIVPSFDYSPCLTPTVFSVSPQIGTRQETSFVITGEGFSTTENIVAFGDTPCMVDTELSSESLITCRLSTEGTPPAFTPLLVSLRNADNGYAYIQTPANATVTLHPWIRRVYQASEGSIAGGTDVVIQGDTFSFTEGEISVRFGGVPCEVTSLSYSEIQCRTTASGGEMEGDLEFYYSENNMPIPTVCTSESDCSFNFTERSTPMVDSISPSIIRGSGPSQLCITGQGFSDNHEKNLAYLNDDIPCAVTSANETFLCCTVPELPASSYSLNLKILNPDDDRCFGYALVSNSAQVLMVAAALTGISPESGSVLGGTSVSISGYGFDVDAPISVTIGTAECVITTTSLSLIVCVSGASEATIAGVTVSIGGFTIPLHNASESIEYEYTMEATPTVNTISPTSGRPDDLVTLTGAGFGSDLAGIEVFIGGEPCAVEEASDAEISCRVGVNFGDGHMVQVIVAGQGSAMVSPEISFTYDINITALSNTSGSVAGQNPITVSGYGFDPSDTTIRICGNLCAPTATVPSVTEIECLVPPASGIGEGAVMLACDVTIESIGFTLTHFEEYVYRSDLTPQVNGINDTRGGTAGGTRLSIDGSGFTGTASVTIAGSPCIVSAQTETNIECVTEGSGRTVRAKVMVFIEGKGFAMSNAEFWYVDLWSSPFTWGGGPLPREGDFVVVPNGQTLVLDTVTPVLGYLLIQGGELIFDREKGDNEVELHTQGALVTSGGRLEVGTEEAPFTSKTQIVLYGHVLSTEIPVYGAKTLAVREGEIDLHGRVVDVTWTRLSQTANAGETTIYLQDIVDWEVGGKIVLASTSFSQRENEEMEIAAIDEGDSGSILTLTSPLEYEHISVEQEIAGRRLETRGEVGYLTRNIVVRGNRNEEWEELVPDCPEEFRPGQFQVQTCFRGRFGAEIVGDQFGSQIMIHAPEQNQGLVAGRIEYVEVTHAGQAFRLGRYPIHFHLNGNVSGSYVRGCAIHHTFNRAVTIHAVDHLLVEKNVAFNILGHAYFLEDGIEQYNIIQDNLGIFVRASSSLLNVDITPATFWVVNPNNILRRNAAAGGTHFGFWYRLPANPTGPSFTPEVCPRKQRVLEFSNNTAHSFGWYGLWVFRRYHPSPSGDCNDQGNAPVYYDNFFAWRNDKGVEFDVVGSLQVRNSVMLDNRFAGVEITDVETVWGDQGAAVSDTLIVGYSGISSDDFCTESGIRTPKSFYLTVSGVTFANFDRSGCYPVVSCSFCKTMQGGFETRYRDISYVNAGEAITKWDWEHQHIHRDMDGTLTRTGSPQLLIPSNDLLDPAKCRHHPESSTSTVQGSICDGDTQFGRLAVYDPTPSSLEFTSLNISNEFGALAHPYVLKRLRGTGPGYMALLELNKTYDLTWVDGLTFTNISYNTLISGFGSDDFVLLRQTYLQSLDLTEFGGISSATNSTVFEDPATAVTGDFTLSEDNELTYIIKGGNFPLNEDRNTYRTYRCFYLDCIPPPPPTLPPPVPDGRPDNFSMWSDVSIWPNQTLPMEGEDVTIPRGSYVLVDVPTLPRFGRLTIQGALEILDDVDRVLEADYIIIDGGRFVAGYPETPFRNNLRIVLHGSNTSPEILGFDFGSPNVGAKAIAVFGELILNAEHQETPGWSMLAETADAGTSSLTLVDGVDWQVGDLIFVTSTSFDAFETEVFELMSVSGGTLVLNDTLQYTHLGEEVTIGGAQYTIRAEVGRLTRSIVIENGDPDLANEQAFGCRVLVTNAGDFFSSVQLQGVEFKGCGQLGYTDTFDPRFALALVNLGTVFDSYIRECSFHDGFNTGIGVFGTNSVEMTHNVIHSTVGPSMILEGSGHVATNNLASLSQFIGTYRDRDEPDNSLWTANFEITGTSRITFTENHAAGGGKAGIHTDGEDCENSDSMIRNNVAHSTLHCFHVGYTDGSSTLCSRFVNIMAYSCYHYGFFAYSQAGIVIQDSTFVNNKAGIYATAIGPPALSHQISSKSVLIEDTTIVSAGQSFECPDDAKRPAIANHKTSHSGLVTPSGGHVGVVIPTFMSGKGGFPKFPWPDPHAYPAIGGLGTLRQVTFVNFANRCAEENDVVIMTSSFSEDANHPMYLEGIAFEADSRYEADGRVIQPESKVFIHMPRLGSINPSDCVDMDCDGLKHILIKDLDGSFTEQGSPRTLVSFAELEWDGDRRRGIGDFRIPKTMLSEADGSRIPVNDIYPEKGIIRGNTFGQDECSYNEDWTMYECANLDHLMLVLESLDADTEVRRLSPIGIGANGFIDLLNGPMDNGWCGGYTCQERISTFYGIVAANFIYTVGLTSTNPQNFGVHLLNSNDDQAMVMRIIYTNPQRLDVYIDQDGQDVYIPPKNAELLDDGNLQYKDLDPSLGDDQFFPLTSDDHGANFYDRALKQLHVNIRGSRTYKIITTPVIMLSLTISTTVDEFFNEEFLVRNLALLLMIPEDRIRVVDVVRETGRRRRRQEDGEGGDEIAIDIEIGDPPASVIEDTGTGMNDTVNMNDTTGGMNTTNTTGSFSFEQLQELTEMVAAAVQTGEILSGSNATVVAAAIEEPEPAPMDPTGGVRATPDTGGPQPEDVGENTTLLTFFEQQQMMEELAANQSTPVTLSLPSRLVITRQASAAGIVEGLPLEGGLAPEVTVLDINNEVSSNLGVLEPWRLTAIIVSGPDSAFLSYETVDVVNGRALFEGLVFSHPGEYRLQFLVSMPSSSTLTVMLTESVIVESRSLSLVIHQQPQDGNTTFTLYPYPEVRLFDSRSHLMDHTWRNVTYYVTAYLLRGDDRAGTGISWQRELVAGVASFENIKITERDEYRLDFRVTASPELSASLLPSRVISNEFEIRTPQFTRFEIIYDVDFGSVINENNTAQEFIQAFEELFLLNYPGVEIYNTTVSQGSIIVSTFVTAVDTRRLVDVIDQVTTDPNTTLSFTFAGQLLVPSSVVQDPAFPVTLEDNLVLILATVIPAGVILLCGLLCICVVCLCRRKRRTKQEFKIKVSPGSKDILINYYGSNPRLLEGENFSSSSPNEFFLEEHEMGEVSSHSSSASPQSVRKEDWVTTTEKVDVSVFHNYVISNPLAAQEEEAEVKEDLGKMI